MYLGRSETRRYIKPYDYRAKGIADGKMSDWWMSNRAAGLPVPNETKNHQATEAKAHCRPCRGGWHVLGWQSEMLVLACRRVAVGEYIAASQVRVDRIAELQ
jgi:hypothetical protein